jgi:ATP-dependent DNA helicase DinG
MAINIGIIMNLIPAIAQALDTLKAKDDRYERREGQLRIMANIGRLIEAFADPDAKRHIAVEGGTGTGKSMGYLLPLFMLHDAQQKDEKKTKIVISTANLTLQQQLIRQDIPRLHCLSNQPEVALVAGRGRYFCQKKAAYVIAKDSNLPLLAPDPNIAKSAPLEPVSYQKVIAMQDELTNRTWSGLRDDLPAGLSLKSQEWQSIAADVASCNTTCPHYHKCPFIASRKACGNADIIVTNHAMIFSDLTHNRILPKPEDTIYVFDEAHHIRHTFREQLATQLSTSGLGKLCHATHGLRNELFRAVHGLNITIKMDKLVDAFEAIEFLTGEIDAHLAQFCHTILANKNEFEQQKGVIDLNEHALPNALIDVFTDLKRNINKLSVVCEKCATTFKDTNKPSEATEHAMQNILVAKDNLEAMETCLAVLLVQRNDYAIAKWVNRNDMGASRYNFTLNTCPVDVATQLKSHLFDRAKATILTSATLRSMGNFDRFLAPLGLSYDNTAVLNVESPFDYAKQSSLHLYPQFTDAGIRTEQQHTQAIVNQVSTRFLQTERKGGLLLFASKRQMYLFNKLIPASLKKHVLLQHEGIERQALVQQHKDKIDRGQKSLLVGCQSLAEGLDLVQDYLELLFIAKIPFSDISSNIVEKSEAKLITQQGGNAFFEMSLADASHRLTQQVGRGIRTKLCECEIHIFDPRLTRTYGTSLVDSLPRIPLTYESA